MQVTTAGLNLFLFRQYLEQRFIIQPVKHCLCMGGKYIVSLNKELGQDCLALSFSPSFLFNHKYKVTISP